MNIRTLQQHVEELLYWELETRNSDALLTVRVMEKFYGANWDQMSRERMLHLLRSVNQESVKRIRADIQNVQRKFLPTRWSIAKMRKWNEKQWKLALGYSIETPADHIERWEMTKHLQAIHMEQAPVRRAAAGRQMSLYEKIT